MEQRRRETFTSLVCGDTTDQPSRHIAVSVRLTAIMRAPMPSPTQINRDRCDPLLFMP